MQVMPSCSAAGRPQAEAVEPSQKLVEPAEHSRTVGKAPSAAKEEPAAKLEEAVEKMNELLQVFKHALQFEVVKPNRIVVRLVDTETGDVIRQVPPEQLLKAFYRMEEAIGILLDEKA